MRYDKPACSIPAVWGPPARDADTPKNEEEQYQIRLKRLTRINATHLRNAIPGNDETALEVAGHIGRYISDITIVDIIRASIKGERYIMHELIRKMLEESILLIAEEKAERQIKRYSA